MNLTTGSPMSLIPATGVVRFTSGHETWSEPVIAYAVVVRWNSAEDPDALMAAPEMETRVEPVVLENGMPNTITTYLDRREGCVTWQMEPDPDPWGHLKPPEPIPDGAPMPEELRRLVNAHLRRPATTRKDTP